jgi:hypothetical protein
MRSFLLVCITVAAWSSLIDAGKPAKRTPEPGYECKIEDRGDFGLIQSDFQILDSGKPHTGYIKWDAGNGQFQNPWTTAAFFRKTDGSYSLDQGYVLIQRGIITKRSGSQKLRLEVTTTPATESGTSRMAGNIERSGGTFHLQLNWPDVSALAIGSHHLYLVARDSHRKLVDKISLDRMMFSRAEPHILSAFVKIGIMTADPHSFCIRSDDLGSDDIVVT